MTESEKDKITSVVQPMYVRECEDSITVLRDFPVLKGETEAQARKKCMAGLCGTLYVADETSDAAAAVGWNVGHGRSAELHQNNSKNHRKRDKHGKNQKKYRRGKKA